MAHICVFGDSISYGAWDTEKEGWVNRLRELLDEKFFSENAEEYIVYNMSVDGDITEGVLNRFESEIKIRLSESETIIIFAIGSNDSEWNNNQKSLRVTPEKFKEKVKKLIELAKNFSNNIVFMGLGPVDEAKVDPIPWLPNTSYKNEYLKQYNNILKSVCDEKSIPFINIFDEFFKTNYKKLLEDGVHPNSKGHKKIFEIVKDFLIENKIVEV